MYPLILGQCSLSLVTVIEGAPPFETIEKFINDFWKLDINQEETWAIANSIKALLHYHQKLEASNDEYQQQFKAQVEFKEDYGGYVFVKFPCFLNKKL